MGKAAKGIEKLPAHIEVELIEYEVNARVSKTILERASGSVVAVTLASSKDLKEKTSPFDNYIQMIKGSAHIVIRGLSTTLLPGHGIIIPAHHLSHIKPNGPFKMIRTVIKSGYEDLL